MRLTLSHPRPWLYNKLKGKSIALSEHLICVPALDYPDRPFSPNHFKAIEDTVRLTQNIAILERARIWIVLLTKVVPCRLHAI